MKSKKPAVVKTDSKSPKELQRINRKKLFKISDADYCSNKLENAIVGLGQLVDAAVDPEKVGVKDLLQRDLHMAYLDIDYYESRLEKIVTSLSEPGCDLQRIRRTIGESRPLKALTYLIAYPEILTLGQLRKLGFSSTAVQRWLRIQVKYAGQSEIFGALSVASSEASNAWKRLTFRYHFDPQSDTPWLKLTLMDLADQPMFTMYDSLGNFTALSSAMLELVTEIHDELQKDGVTKFEKTYLESLTRDTGKLIELTRKLSELIRDLGPSE